MYQSFVQKALHLLSVAFPELDEEAIEKMSIGERDAGLLQFRERMFGSRLKNIAVCPNCSQCIEWEMDSSELHLQSFKPKSPTQVLEVEIADYNIRFRLPDSRDVSLIVDQEIKESSDELLSRCIIEARMNGRIVEKLPSKVKRAILKRMEEEDPQADIQMNLECSNCSHKWIVQFDIVNYFWMEIDSWAKRILQDISILSQAFGWAEDDILNLSPLRRQLYLGMVNL